MEEWGQATSDHQPAPIPAYPTPAPSAEVPTSYDRPLASHSDYSLASNSMEKTYISSSQNRPRSSQLNESHYSEFKKLSSREIKGKSLTELECLREEDGQESLEKSRRRQQGIVLVERKSGPREALERMKQHYDQDYSKFVKETLGKEPREVVARYGRIKKVLQQIATPLLNEHRLNDEKVRELAGEYPEVELLSAKEEKGVSKEGWFQPVREGALPRVPFQSLIHHLLLLRSGKQQVREMGFALRKGKSWFELERRAGELMAARVRLG